MYFHLQFLNKYIYEYITHKRPQFSLSSDMLHISAAAEYTLIAEGYFSNLTQNCKIFYPLPPLVSLLSSTSDQLGDGAVSLAC